MTLLRNLAFGFRATDLWKWLIIGPICFACGIGLMEADRLIAGMKPAIRITRTPNESALVKGTLVVVHVHQVRNRLPCVEARSDRIMLHFPAGANPDSDNFDAAMFFREGRIVATRNGVHDFDLYLNLQSALPQRTGGGWFYRANIYNGCGWIGRIFGGETPIPTPTIPAKFAKE